MGLSMLSDCDRQLTPHDNFAKTFTEHFQLLQYRIAWKANNSRSRNDNNCLITKNVDTAAKIVIKSIELKVTHHLNDDLIP